MCMLLTEESCHEYGGAINTFGLLDSLYSKGGSCLTTSSAGISRMRIRRSLLLGSLLHGALFSTCVHARFSTFSIPLHGCIHTPGPAVTSDPRTLSTSKPMCAINAISCTNKSAIITDEADIVVRTYADSEIERLVDLEQTPESNARGDERQQVVERTVDIPIPSQQNIQTDAYLQQHDYSSGSGGLHILTETEESVRANEVLSKFKGRVVCCHSSLYPYCDIYLCGTLHVAQSSSAMVRETVASLVPDYVIVEVCEQRIDNLIEDDAPHLNINFVDVVRAGWSQRSFKEFGMGLLSWMQSKAARGMDSKLGGELAAAAHEAAKLKSVIILGDRAYAVTIQRVFDKLGFFEKFKMAGILIWEVITMSLNKLKDYIKKSEVDDDFVRKEIEKFGRYLPSVADIIINERDEYLSQTILETARIGFRSAKYGPQRRGCIVAVVGAGHLVGIQKWIDAGGVSAERLAAISSSSKHQSTWPGYGTLSVIDGKALYPNL